MGKEKTIEGYLKDRVENAYGMCLKFPPIFIAGFPDRIVLMPKGVIVFVETKATGEKPRLLQTRIHNRLRRLGFRVEVIDSKEGVDKFMLSI